MRKINNNGNNRDTGYLKKGKGEGGLVVVVVDVWRIGTGRSRDNLGEARARYLNTGRLSEGLPGSGFRPEGYSG
jgi:hypothetical protein